MLRYFIRLRIAAGAAPQRNFATPRQRSHNHNIMPNAGSYSPDGSPALRIGLPVRMDSYISAARK
jgi:hypothetical protein